MIATFDADGVHVELRRLSSVHEPEGYAVSWGATQRMRMAARAWDVPSLALVAGWIVFWIGSHVCVAPLDGLSVYECETPQEIVTVLHSMEGQWLIVTELGVEMRSSDLLSQTARYEHGEIILSAEMSGGELIVRDLDGRHVRLGLPQLDAL